MKKRVLLLGILFGLLVPYIGIFIGLQVSTILGNILAFPIIVVAFVTSIPFGMWSPVLWIITATFSVVIWVAIFSFINYLIKKI